jgi:SAM-dependent methyltransferase
MMIRPHTEFAPRYVANTPLALALERTLECQLLSKREFAAPMLDIGCGDGFFAEILFADKITTGIDYDAKEIERAERRGAYEELISCPGAAIPKPDATFRTALSNSVLEHIPDLPPVLREVHRLLMPGGRFYFTVPTDLFEQYALVTRALNALGLKGAATSYRNWYNRFWRHFHAYRPDKWKQLATDAGFEVLEMIRYNPESMTTRNDVLTPVAISSSIWRRLLGRWVLAPGLRQAFLGWWAKWMERKLSQDGVSDDGSLLLVVAQKPMA